MPNAQSAAASKSDAKRSSRVLDDFERRRLLHRPRHPGAQVIQIRVDGAFEQRRILASPAAQHQSARHDPFR